MPPVRRGWEPSWLQNQNGWLVESSAVFYTTKLCLLITNMNISYLLWIDVIEQLHGANTAKRFAPLKTAKLWVLCSSQSVRPDWAIFCTLGKFLKPLATTNLPKSLTFLGNICKGVKSYHFYSEIIFGQFLQTFGEFFLVTLFPID